MNKKMDVLIYLSDQHAASCAGFMGDKMANTPNLDKIAKNSVVFDNAFTTCPLCVPARASLMTSRMPSNIGVFNNQSEYKSQEVTFAHLFALSGYETNLIGRMHFVGMDFYHGFTRRIGKDITNSYWGYIGENRKDWGDFKSTYGQLHCLDVIGSGDSPVLEYDRTVVSDALKFYDNDYTQPQMTVVGTYSPHFPYMGDKEKMEKYEKIIKENYKKDEYIFGDSPVKYKIQEANDEDIIKLRAAYYAMIEVMDEQIGEVYTKYQQYLKRNNKKGIFIYMSDHGDQIGYHEMYGKQTFFEKSVKIPLVFQMDGIKAKRIDEPIDIMDIGPTLCELNDIESFPVSDGKSFESMLHGKTDEERYSISEYYDNKHGEVIYGQMIYKAPYKLITYKDYVRYDMLFDIKEDPEEHYNLVNDNKKVVQTLKEILQKDTRIHFRKDEYVNNVKNAKVLSRFGKDHIEYNRYTYEIPKDVQMVAEEAKREPRTFKYN